jgi:hypothetical protein
MGVDNISLFLSLSNGVEDLRFPFKLVAGASSLLILPSSVAIVGVEARDSCAKDAIVEMIDDSRWIVWNLFDVLSENKQKLPHQSQLRDFNTMKKGENKWNNCARYFVL